MRHAPFVAIASICLLVGGGCLRSSADPVSSPIPGGSSEAESVIAPEGTAAAAVSIPSDAELDALAMKERRVWRYDDGIRHIYSRDGGKGRFFQTDGSSWKHQIDMFPSDAKNFEEVARTDDFVELKDWTGTQIYRLYADRFELRPSDVAEFSKVGPGRWVPAVDPREIAQIVDERKFWRYENAPDIFPNQASHAGVFRQENPRSWIEDRVGNVRSNWIEESRTDDYVELSRPDGGFFVRLYADRSDYRYGNESEFKPMFPGKWVGDAKLPPSGP